MGLFNPPRYSRKNQRKRGRFTVAPFVPATPGRTTFRQTALNLIKNAKGKMSFKTARQAAGWLDNFLDHAINQIEFTT